jgi:hypothetical protein
MEGEDLWILQGRQKFVEGARSRTVDDKYWQIQAKVGEESSG